MLGQGGDELAQRAVGAGSFELPPGDETTFRQLGLRDVGVDGQVSGHIGDTVRLELTTSAVFEGQVETLVLEETLDLGVAET